MILEEIDILKKFFRNILRFFDEVGIFKGLISHDAESGGKNFWYQNVRKDERNKSLRGP